MKRIAILAFLFVSLIMQANSPISVQVLDENLEPLTGVKIIEMDEDQTLYTDFDGLVNLTDVNQTKNYIVEMPGYHSTMIQLKPGEEIQNIQLVLIPLGQY